MSCLELPLKMRGRNGYNYRQRERENENERQRRGDRAKKWRERERERVISTENFQPIFSPLSLVMNNTILSPRSLIDHTHTREYMKRKSCCRRRRLRSVLGFFVNERKVFPAIKIEGRREKFPSIFPSIFTFSLKIKI